MSKLYQDILLLRQRQHGQSYTVEHWWEEGAEGKAVQEGTLPNQIADSVRVQTETIWKEQFLKLVALDHSTAGFVSEEAPNGFSYHNYGDVLWCGLDAESDHEFDVSHGKHRYSIPERN